MFAIQRPTGKQLDQILGEATSAAVTYPSVGATMADTAPAGYRHDRWKIDLGSSPGVFERASASLRGWEVHRGAGIEVIPSVPPSEGATVVLVLSFLGVSVTAACRVIWVVDDDLRYGFGYGTLPHHPEQGEEAFIVESQPDGSVVFEIRAFSRPGSFLVRAAGPLARSMQLRATSRYLQAMADWMSKRPDAGMGERSP